MDKKEYEVVIIGAGPAGLSCGQYSSRAGRKTIILEELSPGGQLMIIDQVENYPALEKTSGYNLAMQFEKQASEFGCDISYTTALDIKLLEDSSFLITTSDALYHSKVVVIATGTQHRCLGVSGEERLQGHGVSYCATCDGPFFRNKKILICGGGDSALQESIFLTKISRDLTICHRRDTFRAQDALVKKINDYNIKTLMNTEVLSINGSEKVESVTFLDKNTNNTFTKDFDAVFVFVGSTARSQLASMCNKTLDGFIITDSYMRTNVPGLFAIGDVRDTVFRQIVTSCSDGAIAAHYANEYLEKK